MTDTERTLWIVPVAALTFAALLASPAGVRGQKAAGDTAATRTDAPPPPADFVRTVEDLIVTAHRVPLPREALTSSVTVLDRRDIERSGAEHVGDLLRSVPGADVVQSGSRGQPTSLFVRGGESNYVQVLVDGVPVNQPGGDFDFSTLSADNVERIELVRGPVSVLYGSSAVSGVVQIFTRDGEGRPTLSGGLRGGAHGTVDGDVSAAGSTGPVSWSASLSRFATDGLRDFNDDFTSTVASARVELAGAARTDASLSLRYNDSEAHTPTDAAGQAVDENQFRTGERLVAALEAGHRLTPRLEARVQVRWSELDSGFDDARDGPADTTGVFAFRSESEVTRKSVDVRLDYRLPGPTVFTAGAQVEDEEEDSSNRSRSAFGTTEGSLTADRDNTGYYAQAVTRLADRLSLSAGFRVDDNESFGAFETGRLGAALDVTSSTRVRGSWGTAFKEPTFLENFASGFVTGNPDLEPERSESWEVGVEQRLADGDAVLEATWFDQDFEDLIQFTGRPPSPGAPNFFNVAAADARGVEALLSLRPTPAIGAELSYTWLDTEVDDAGFATGPDASFVEGDRLLRRPTHRAAATLAWTPRDGGAVRLEAGWVGERDDRDFSTFPAERTVLEDYLRVDLSARWPLVEPGGGTPGLVPTLRLDNVLDVDYEEVRNFPARGRSLFLGLETSLQL